MKLRAPDEKQAGEILVAGGARHYLPALDQRARPIANRASADRDPTLAGLMRR